MSGFVDTGLSKLRVELDKFGFRDVLGYESMELVAKLFQDWIQKSEKLKKVTEEAKYFSKISEELEEGVAPFKEENVRLIKENSQLRVAILHAEENAEETILGNAFSKVVNPETTYGSKCQLRNLECENADLKLLVKQFVRKTKALEVDSLQKSYKIGLLQERNSEDIVVTSEETKKSYSSKKQKMDIHSFVPYICPHCVRIKNYVEYGNKYKDPTMLDYAKLADSRIEALQIQNRNLKSQQNELTDMIASLEKKVGGRDSEIDKLKGQVVVRPGGMKTGSRGNMGGNDFNRELHLALKAAQMQLEILQTRNLQLEKKLQASILEDHAKLMSGSKGSRINHEVLESLLDLETAGYPTHDNMTLNEKVQLLEAQLSHCCKEKAKLKILLEDCENRHNRRPTTPIGSGGSHYSGSDAQDKKRPTTREGIPGSSSQRGDKNKSNAERDTGTKRAVFPGPVKGVTTSPGYVLRNTRSKDSEATRASVLSNVSRLLVESETELSDFEDEYEDIHVHHESQPQPKTTTTSSTEVTKKRPQTNVPRSLSSRPHSRPPWRAGNGRTEFRPSSHSDSESRTRLPKAPMQNRYSSTLSKIDEARTRKGDQENSLSVVGRKKSSLKKQSSEHEYPHKAITFNIGKTHPDQSGRNSQDSEGDAVDLHHFFHDPSVESINDPERSQAVSVASGPKKNSSDLTQGKAKPKIISEEYENKYNGVPISRVHGTNDSSRREDPDSDVSTKRAVTSGGFVDRNTYSGKANDVRRDSARPTVNQFLNSVRPNENQFRGSVRPTENQFRESVRPNENQFRGSVRPTENQFRESVRPTENQFRDTVRPNENQFRDTVRPNENQFRDTVRPTVNQSLPDQDAELSEYEDEYENSPRGSHLQQKETYKQTEGSKKRLETNVNRSSSFGNSGMNPRPPLRDKWIDPSSPPDSESRAIALSQDKKNSILDKVAEARSRNDDHNQEDLSSVGSSKKSSLKKHGSEQEYPAKALTFNIAKIRPDQAGRDSQDSEGDAVDLHHFFHDPSRESTKSTYDVERPRASSAVSLPQRDAEEVTEQFLKSSTFRHDGETNREQEQPLNPLQMQNESLRKELEELTKERDNSREELRRVSKTQSPVADERRNPKILSELERNTVQSDFTEKRSTALSVIVPDRDVYDRKEQFQRFSPREQSQEREIEIISQKIVPRPSDREKIDIRLALDRKGETLAKYARDAEQYMSDISDLKLRLRNAEQQLSRNGEISRQQERDLGIFERQNEKLRRDLEIIIKERDNSMDELRRISEAESRLNERRQLNGSSDDTDRRQAATVVSFPQRDTYDLTQQFKRFTTREQSLEREINTLKAGLNALDRDKDDMRFELDRKDERLAKYAHDIEQYLSDISDLKLRLKNAELQMSHNGELSHEQEGKLSILQRQNESLRRDLEIIMKERDNSMDELRRISKTQSRVEGERRSISSELDKRNKETEELKRQLQKYIDEVRRIEDLLMRKEEEYDSILEQYRTLTAEHSSLENQRIHLEKEANTIKREVLETAGQNATLKSKITTQSSLVKSYEDEIERLSLQIASLETKLSSLLYTEKTLREESKSTRDLCLKLETNLDKTRLELAGSMSSQKKLDAENRELRLQLETLNQELGLQTEKYDRLEETIGRTRENEFSVRRSVQDLTNEREAQSRNNDISMRRIESLTEEASKYRLKCTELQSELDKTRRQLLSQNIDHENTVAELRTLQDQLSTSSANYLLTSTMDSRGSRSVSPSIQASRNARDSYRLTGDRSSDSPRIPHSLSRSYSPDPDLEASTPIGSSTARSENPSIDRGTLKK